MKDSAGLVRKELADVEARHGVEVLFACESGSRAWGFASPDSDFDVRFIYRHPQDWYLSLREERDVIETGMLDRDGHVLDMAGWDVRKALRLFVKGNPVLLEWLSSPVVYTRSDPFVDGIGGITGAAFNPLSSYHHYVSMAQKHHAQFCSGPSVRLKKYLYTLRALFACRWICEGKGQPPMDFRTLLAGQCQDAALREAVLELMETKARHDEDVCLAPHPLIHPFVEAELAALLAKREAMPPRQGTEALFADADAFFKRCIGADAPPPA